VKTRTLRTSAFASREELADALQSLFVAELLQPSTPMWLVTPWISDVVVIDNRTGAFSGLVPDLAVRQVRLTEVLVLQMARGGEVVIACRPDAHNTAFVEQITQAAKSLSLLPRLQSQQAADLHEKGILSRHALLSGSMNLTYNGLRRLEESILITNDPDAMARARHAYEDRWGRP
jgi:hypothetical protein